PTAWQCILSVGVVFSLDFFRTVTLVVAVAVLPAASNAEAVSVTEPSATVVESQLNWYGAVVLVPTSVVLARNSTRVTPTLSLALAVAATTHVPSLLAPVARLQTDGGDGS